MLGANVWLTFAVEQAKKIELIDPKYQFGVLLNALILPILVFIVLYVPENVILHEHAPIQTSLIVNHGFEVLIALESDLQLL